MLKILREMNSSIPIKKKCQDTLEGKQREMKQHMDIEENQNFGNGKCGHLSKQKQSRCD